MNGSLPPFHLLRARTVNEAIAASAAHSGSRFLAGGSDLLVNMRHGISRPDLLVDLSAIDELAEIEADEQGIAIGAGVRIASLARNEFVSRYAALAQAAVAVAGPGHRSLGTIGGNLCLDTRCIYYNQSEWWRKANNYCLKNGGDTCHVAPQGQRCHAAFTGDLAPALLVLGAEIEIAGAQGRRRISLRHLYVEDGKAHLALANDELIVRVRLPHPIRSAYAKIRTRAAIDYPLAGVAVGLAMSGAVIDTLRVAVTGTNSRPFLLAGTETMTGRKLDDNVLQEIGRLVQKQVQPMRTTLTSANYRRLAAAALAKRLIADLGATNAD
ncbi:MAG TPA: 4-hydroxybenzoyl-CoA reductase subunit beta [Pseudolabrys sp.]|nr:4-hydroxybenzoyl-CoA reductase subunit beta [Pseudolabrys sp.]